MNEELNEEMMSAGWDAIDQEMRKIYGEQEPKHYGTLISYALGGPDPLDGISAYKADEPYPHWHFVTYGFTELYEKESENEEESGFGFELTFRLARKDDEEEPPAWALNLLQNMGRYVFNTGNVFQAGDHLDANGPICLGADTQLTALAFVTDPQLAEIDTPNGRVQFLQMVGITGDELDAMMAWNTRGVLQSGLPYMPSYITDLERDSLLCNSTVSDAVQKGMEQEGSNTAYLFVSQLGWEPGKKGFLKKAPSTLSLGAKQAEVIGKILRGRMRKGESLSLLGPDVRIVFESGANPECIPGEDVIRFVLDDATTIALTKQLLPKESSFEIPSLKGIAINIVKTNITDSEGNVVKVIG
ncbi:suppressor of fused domain protein [Brevibacillus sp. AF8]|nr:suppressor of fused domain protein [Brevibacillus sp. AF8]